ncbi:unnamed protein product [Boreogadus saida]
MRVSASAVLLFVASFIVAPGLPPPSRQVSPIPLIGGKVQVLSVAGWSEKEHVPPDAAGSILRVTGRAYGKGCGVLTHRDLGIYLQEKRR